MLTYPQLTPSLPSLSVVVMRVQCWRTMALTEMLHAPIGTAALLD